MDLLNSVITGLITGAFSAGAVYGVLKTELHFLRRDVDEVRDDIREHLRDCGAGTRAGDK